MTNQNKKIAEITGKRDVAENDVTTKEEAKNAADEKLSDEQAALDKIDLNSAQKAAQDAANKVTQDNDDLAIAQGKLANKEQANSEAQTALNTAQQASDTASSEKATKQTEFDSSQAALDEANKAAKPTQDLVDGYNTQLSELHELSKNTITIPDVEKFKKAFVDYQRDGQLDADDIAYVNEARKNNTYLSNEADKQVKIDLNNITDDQIKEISLFTADIMSKLRSQLGWSKDKVTQGSLDFAKAVAEKYEQDFQDGKWKFDPDNNDGQYWHDASGINDLSDEWGLESNETRRDTSQRYEDATDPWFSDDTITMDELKSSIYDTLNSMIFPDGNGFDEPGKPAKYEMGHTAGILGAETSDSDNNNILDLVPKGTALKQYVENYQWIPNVGLPWNGKTYTSKEQLLSEVDKEINDGQYVAAIINKPNPDIHRAFTHFINVDPSDVKETSKFDTNEIPSYEKQIVDVQAKLDAAKKELEPLQAAVDKATAARDAAQTALDTATANADAKKTALIAAQATLEQAKLDVQSANDKVNELRSALDADKQNAATAQDTYESTKQLMKLKLMRLRLLKKLSKVLKVN